MDIFAHTISPSLPALSGTSSATRWFFTAIMTPPPCIERGLWMEPSKFLGRTSEGFIDMYWYSFDLGFFENSLISLSEGILVSEINMISIRVESANSANSALFPLMLLALKVPILKLFLCAGGRTLKVALEESLDARDVLMLVLGRLDGLLVILGSNLVVGEVTLLRNTESSPGIPARGS